MEFEPSFFLETLYIKPNISEHKPHQDVTLYVDHPINHVTVNHENIMGGSDIFC